MSTPTTTVTRAEVCVAACADAWAGDGEILASPMGLVPTIGARLCRLTTNPDLVLSDGEALLLGEVPPVGTPPAVVEGWLPFRTVFDVVAYGKRHVMMGASQLDRYGNQNISAIGDWAKPKRQLLGVRGAPGNTVNNPTSYWVPKHSTRVFVPAVDVVSGVGNDRAAAAPASARRFHDLRVVVTDLAVLDYDPAGLLRLRSVHPGVTVDQVQEATGFELVLTGEVPTTREPDAEELRIIREVLDPRGARDREVPPA
ncbi:CoA-transferase subunit beta [Pseudonocardia lutea]|uniref:CoA-transferase subunit beta n=1 Tax=Pseudonocardia lutea TaxID=2172015 RepID=A0ABW1IDM7_9PSEU